MAVLEKRLGLALSSCDAYVNIAGGVRINEPSVDLAVVCAILSSYKNIPLNDRLMVFGEVGLVGEIRAVRQAQQCIREGEKLGFDRCILPKASMDAQIVPGKMKLYGAGNIQEIYKILTEM